MYDRNQTEASKSALVEILEEKGIVTQEEWEERIKIKTIKAGGTKSYRDIQFSSKL